MAKGGGVNGWVLLRVVVAALLAAHGWHRLLTGGVVPFGGYLDSRGLSFGFAIAASITAFEILATPLLALGKFVLPIALVQAAILTVGIVMVHAPSGWWVVGAGRNGMEYSVLLIACLLALAIDDARK